MCNLNVIVVLELISRDLYLLFAIRFSSKFQNSVLMYFYPLGRDDQFVSGERLYFLLSIAGAYLYFFFSITTFIKLCKFFFVP